MKIQNRKRCEWIMEDGFKCNRYFSKGVRHAKYCEEHSKNTLASGLVRSTNAFAQGGNDEKMREWVMTEMNNKNRHGIAISNINLRLDTLSDSLDDETRVEKVVRRVLLELAQDEVLAIAQIERLESMIMKLNNKIIALQKGKTTNQVPELDIPEFLVNQEEE